ncbi:MAG: hypothetical protein WCK65_06535 [Rhodospirillaceae bacterium]
MIIGPLPFCPTASRRFESQEGAVLPFVMVMMMVLMMIGTGVFEYIVLTEVKAVDASLADVRAYWAMMGHFNYMAVRASQGGLCSGTGKYTVADPLIPNTMGANAATLCGTDFSVDAAAIPRPALTTASIGGSLQDYLDNANELHWEAPVGTIINPGRHRWFYPLRTDTAATTNFWFDVWASVRPRDANSLVLNGNNNDQFFIMDIELNRNSAALSALPAIGGILQRWQRLMIGFCAVDSAQVIPATNPVTYANTGCGAAGVANLEGQVRIQFMQRAPLCGAASCAPVF